MIDVTVVIKKEKAIKDIGDTKVNEGISIQGLVKPEKKNSWMLNPGTTRVTIYSVIEEEIHLKRPNVNRFSGRSKRLIIGLTRKEVSIIPSPAKKRLFTPFSKYIPDTAWLIK